MAGGLWQCPHPGSSVACVAVPLGIGEVVTSGMEVPSVPGDPATPQTHGTQKKMVYFSAPSYEATRATRALRVSRPGLTRVPFGKELTPHHCMWHGSKP